MTTLPQPPPDAPEPPPGKEAIASHRKALGIGLVGLATLLLLAIPALNLMETAPATPLVMAMNNIRQIGIALFEFDAEYGRFPDASTIASVKSDTKTPLDLDDSSSNKIFRQLLAWEVKSEKLFWAKTAGSRKMPDDVFGSNATALKPGECGFAYIAGLASWGDPKTPVVMTPLLPGKKIFDPKPFGGKAVILFLDNSARALPIDAAGHVMINGMDIFDPRQSFWKGSPPDVKWPE